LLVSKEKQLKTKPKTTPECEQLMDIVLTGLRASDFDQQKKKNAVAALERLCKKRCTKAIAYIMDESSKYSLDGFAVKICEKARNCL
jgi:hypothetical protein